MKLLTFFLVISCSHKNLSEENLRTKWVGRKVEELLNHPEFKKNKFSASKNTNMTQSYRFSSSDSYYTKARSEALGGQHPALSRCEHLFTTKDKIIVNYEQLGVCSTGSHLEPH